MGSRYVVQLVAQLGEVWHGQYYNMQTQNIVTVITVNHHHQGMDVSDAMMSYRLFVITRVSPLVSPERCHACWWAIIFPHGVVVGQVSLLAFLICLALFFSDAPPYPSYATKSVYCHVLPIQ